MGSDRKTKLGTDFATHGRSIPQDGRDQYWPLAELPTPTVPVTIPDKGDFSYVDQFHNTYYYRDGEQHRDNGPAIVGPYILAWYKNGQKHREDDLPAVIRADDLYDLGEREWWVNGEQYRAHGRLDGRQDYWPMTEKPAPTKLQKPVTKGDCVIVDEFGTTKHYRDGALHRDDGGPAVYNDYSLQWWRHGQKHRDNDLPAVIIADTMDDMGYREWWQNGVKHRETGKAVIRTDRLGQYWLDGHMYENKTEHAAAVQDKRAAEANATFKNGGKSDVIVRKPLKLQKRPVSPV